MATKRTPLTGETLPQTAPTAPSTSIKLKQIKLICPVCALEYCPNFLQYATPTIPVVASLDKKQPCQYCGARSQVGVTDPANYGGVHPSFEK